jgi:hypothetical protein
MDERKGNRAKNSEDIGYIKNKSPKFRGKGKDARFVNGDAVDLKTYHNLSTLYETGTLTH